jgi:hypothetical protein
MFQVRKTIHRYIKTPVLIYVLQLEKEKSTITAFVLIKNCGDRKLMKGYWLKMSVAIPFAIKKLFKRLNLP